MYDSGASRQGWATTNSANLYGGGDGGMCVCVCVCLLAHACSRVRVRACVRDVFVIYGNTI